MSSERIVILVVVCADHLSVFNAVNIMTGLASNRL